MEYEFRAKAKEDFIEYHEKGGHYEKGDWYYFTLLDLFNKPYLNKELDWSTLGMCITLCDQKGKKIYAGDIIKTEIHKFDPDDNLADEIFHLNLAVEWVSPWAMFAVKWEDRLYQVVKDDNFIPDETVVVAEESEIVGSIHDNPEILSQ